MGCPVRCCTRRSTATKAASASAAPASGSSAAPLDQPASGPCSTPQVSSARAAVNSSAPARSSRCASGLRDSGMQRSPSTSAASATAATQSTTPRQPATPSNQPDSNGPKARPTPNDVPTPLKARMRAVPSNTWASAAVPPASAAAAPRPCSARSRLNTTMAPCPPRQAWASALASTTPNPVRKTRRRPCRSASAPAAISVAPKLSMKAFVTQFSASGPPPSASRSADRATAGPVKLSGIASAARHTDNSTQTGDACGRAVPWSAPGAREEVRQEDMVGKAFTISRPHMAGRA